MKRAWGELTTTLISAGLPGAASESRSIDHSSEGELKNLNYTKLKAYSGLAE